MIDHSHSMSIQSLRVLLKEKNPPATRCLLGAVECSTKDASMDTHQVARCIFPHRWGYVDKPKNVETLEKPLLFNFDGKQNHQPWESSRRSKCFVKIDALLLVKSSNHKTRLVFQHHTIWVCLLIKNLFARNCPFAIWKVCLFPNFHSSQHWNFFVACSTPF